MRITTKAIMQGYNRNLSLALGRWNKAQNRVLTQKNFTTAAEDPAGANRSLKARRQFRQNATQLEMTKQTQALVDEVTSSAMQISDIVTKKINFDDLRALNGTSSEADRKTYANTLRGMQESIVLIANSQLSGRFIFGGASTHEVPFELSEDGKTLTYRGLDVSDPKNQAELDKLAKETLFVDLGFGLKEDANGKTIDSSAFNAATPGIEMLGYGVDEKGLPNNVVSLMGKMSEALEDPNFDYESFRGMVDKFQKDCINTVTDYESSLGVKQNFLEGTASRLESFNDTLNQKIVDIEQVNMPEAISTYMWMGYAYNAALKVGTNIVSNSLLDFMR